MKNKKLIQDVKYLVPEFCKRHKDINVLITQEELNSITKLIISEIDNNNFKTKYFSVVLQKLFAIVKDKHSHINRSNEPNTPFFFEYIDGYYYTVVVPKNKKDLLLKRLVSINNITIEKFIKLIDDVIIYNNPEAQKVEIARALSDFNLINYVLQSSSKEIVYKFEDGIFVKSGRRLKNSKQTSIFKTKGLEFLKEKPNYFLLNKNNSIYIKYSRCREDRDYSMKEFMKDIKLSLKKKPHKIIVDFRNNQGGDSSLFNNIYDLLNLYITENKSDLYCLINRKVFSSGTINTYTMKYQLGAKLVGQPAGQGINHFGYSKSFELPNSKLEVIYSSEYWKFVNGNSPIIEPDVYIEPTIKDYRNAKDPVLKYCYSN